MISCHPGNQVFIYHVYYFFLPWISWIFKALQLTLFHHKDSKSFKNICNRKFVTEKGPGRCLTINFASSLSIRKKFSQVISYISIFHSGQAPWLAVTPTHYCDNIAWRFFQFLWVFSFSQPAIVNLVFTKIAEMCNECTKCACHFVYNWAWCSA